MRESFQDAISAERPVLVDFFATWCGPCQSMHPVLEEVKRQLGERIRIIKVDVDGRQAIASAYAVQSVPTLILFKDGKILWRGSGAMTVAGLLSVLREFL